MVRRCFWVREAAEFLFSAVPLSARSTTRSSKLQRLKIPPRGHGVLVVVTVESLNPGTKQEKHPDHSYRHFP